MGVGERGQLCEAMVGEIRRHRHLWDRDLRSVADDPLDWTAEYQDATGQGEQATELSNKVVRVVSIESSWERTSLESGFFR
jgi:hypothetical protein